MPAAFPPVDQVFSAPERFMLAVHRAALEDGFRATITRTEPAYTQLTCSALGYGPGRCVARFGLHFDGAKWRVADCSDQHNHPFIASDMERARELGRIAIARLEADIAQGGRIPRKRRRSIKQPQEGGRDVDDEYDSASSGSASHSGSESEAPRVSASAPAPPRRRDQRHEHYPSAPEVAQEVEQLIAAKGGFVRFPRPTLGFASSRALVLYLHAAAQTHNFHVYRTSPAGLRTDVRFGCRLGHTQSSHRPLCSARYRANQGDDGKWRMVEDTYTQHTHDVLDDDGRVIKAVLGNSRPATPTSSSVKRPPAPASSHSLHRPSLPPTTSNRVDQLKGSHSHPTTPRASTSPGLSKASSKSKSRSSAPPLSVAYLPNLALLLTSLHPRLGTLAPTLLNEGRIDSLDRVVLLLGLQETERDLFLRELKGLPPLERALLKKQLGRAREGALAKLAGVDDELVAVEGGGGGRESSGDHAPTRSASTALPGGWGPAPSRQESVKVKREQ